MNRKYKLLLMGEFDSVFTANFIINLKKENPNAQIFYWGTVNEFSVDESHKCLDCLEEYYIFDDNTKLDRIPYCSMLTRLFIWRREFKKFVDCKRFDVVSVSYIRYCHTFILDIINRCSSKLVAVPYGSDVLRVGKIERFFQKILYKNADYIKGPKGKFTEIVKKEYKVPDSKLVSLHLGSSLIDYILEKRNVIDSNQAKKALGIESYYVITCGYNASLTQNHLSIVESVNLIKKQLPHNLMLLFPLTYGRNLAYVESIKKRVCELGLNALYFEEFLDIPKLFLLRQATDIFIHIQSSDAFSASIREYLLCEKKVINGSWLKYSDLEADDVAPYFITKDVSTLPDTILKTYQSESLPLSNKAYNTIARMGWSVIKDWNDLFVSIS